ncbi:MAG TPA: NrfD/PsrC family molybdoenzyme membrane anchor subunit [Pirellulales bacterium]|jgi:Ni/Fe-hydrogenase subunit HybB-like protein|nr:NrfD/PsrC family molybdoenzyme membrane anchor subunit [Pirellulales bacterium]
MTVTKAPEWHGSIVWDALLNGMATGLFMAAAVSELAVPAVFTPVAKVAYPVALVLLLVDLVLLVLDLGDPFRFHHMLRVFKPHSPMSVGTWCLTIFSLPLTAAAALSLLAEMEMDFEWARKLAVILGLLPGFGSAAYKGVLLSTNSQPGWKDARWMGGYLTNSALLLGCAELLVLTVLMGRPQAATILRTAFIALLVLNVIPLGLLFADLHPTLARLFTRAQRWRTGILTFTAGTLIPLVLLLLGDGLFFVSGAVFFLLLGSLGIRYVYVKIPHTSPLPHTAASQS